MEDSDFAAYIMFAFGFAGVIIIIIMEVLHRKKLKKAAEQEKHRIPR